MNIDPNLTPSSVELIKEAPFFSFVAEDGYMGTKHYLEHTVTAGKTITHLCARIVEDGGQQRASDV